MSVKVLVPRKVDIDLQKSYYADCRAKKYTSGSWDLYLTNNAPGYIKSQFNYISVGGFTHLEYFFDTEENANMFKMRYMT